MRRWSSAPCRVRQVKARCGAHELTDVQYTLTLSPEAMTGDGVYLWCR